MLGYRISAAEPLTEEEQIEKDQLISEGFENWSRRDFQQFIRALETYGWYVYLHYRGIIISSLVQDG